MSDRVFVPQMYFPTGRLAVMFDRDRKTIARKIQAGEFGPLDQIVLDGGEYLVPSTGVAHYVDSHRASAASAGDTTNLGIKARSPGEARRKFRQQASSNVRTEP